MTTLQNGPRGRSCSRAGPARHRARRFAFVALAALGVVLSACDVRRVAEFALVGDQFRATLDIPYDTGARQQLDVYQPVDAVSARVPVVVFFYGGRWQDGDRHEYKLAGDAITRRGYVAVIPDYRLAPAVSFPAWIDDAARALRWVRDSIGRYGGDSAQIFVVGHSAGAHTATVLSLDDRYLLHAGVQPESIKGFVSIAGPVDTVWTDPDVQALMGPREQWPGTYPAQLVSSTRHQPLLLLHGGKDETVLPVNSTRLAQRIRQLGGVACSKVYPTLTHTSIVVAFMVPRLRQATVMDDVDAFVRNPTASRCGAVASPPAP